MTENLQPVVCTLTTKDAASRSLEWAELRTRLLRSEIIENGAVAVFPITLADGVEDLAAREATCCAFLELSTTRDEKEIHLVVRSDHPDAAPVIAHLTGTDLTS